MDIFINKKKWRLFSEDEMNDFVDAVYTHYRDAGFPYFPTSDTFRKNEFRKLDNYDFNRIIDRDNKVIRQSMHGLSLAWSYMPHSWGIRCGKLKTPLEIFNDDDLFRKAIIKRIQMGDNMSDNGIRKMLKLFTGAQSVSNFRPTASSAIYSLFAEDGSTVWDMSAGFGGRMLGAIRYGVNYVGTDPSTLTFNGLKEMANDFGNGINIELHKIGSEDFEVKKDSFSFAFTSPPYFDWEEYSNEDTQSYIKFPTKELWLDGYLRETFNNCYHGLVSEGKMAINVCNTNVGFELDDMWKLALSNPVMKNGKDHFKYEPIFIFRK
jgi:hypothetical protein